MPDVLNIAMIGAGFMGRAHSQAWASANRFFDLPRRIVMHTVCGSDFRKAKAFAERWGWQNTVRDWREIVSSDAIDLVDVVTPNHLHARHAMAALEAGKHVACEKPLAGTLREARAMRDAAAQAARSRKRRTFVWFNYRRCPAVAFARELLAEGRLGRIYHVRAKYLQDWGGPRTPMSWRFDAKLAGSGAHGDLNAHIVDMARFITGDELVEVTGAIEKRFVDDRTAARQAASGRRTRKTGRSSVDDCVLFLARFAGGAVGSFEATRLAIGNLNCNSIEVNGSRGSLQFDFERMNELEWWDNTLPPAQRGWSTISCTVPGKHPYVEAYWPPGHPIGYEHTFISQAADMVRVVAGRKPIAALPDFEDAYETQRVLEAALHAARKRKAVGIGLVK